MAEPIATAEIVLQAKMDSLERDLQEAQRKIERFKLETQSATGQMNSFTAANANTTKALENTTAALDKAAKAALEYDSKWKAMNIGIAAFSPGALTAQVLIDKFASAWRRGGMEVTLAVGKLADASKQLLDTRVFEGMVKGAQALKINVDDLFGAFQRLDRITQPIVGGDEFTNRIGQLFNLGQLGKDNAKALQNYQLAVTSEQKFKAVSELITDAYQKGQVLAAFDLASKLLPPDLYQRFRAFPDLLDQLNRKMKESTPAESAVTYFAASIQNQLDDAKNAMDAIPKKWKDDMTKPWAERPWRIARYFSDLLEEWRQTFNQIDAMFKQLWLGFSGNRPQVRRTLFEGLPDQEDEARAFRDPNSPGAFAAQRLRRGMGFGANRAQQAGFGPDQLAQLRWSQQYADGLTKLNVLIRDHGLQEKQAAEAVETSRRVYGDATADLSALGLAYRSVKERIAEMGGSLATSEVAIDQSAGTIARTRTELQLWDLAVQKYKLPQLVPQSEINKIKSLGDELETAIKSRAAAADFSAIAGALGDVATASEVLFARQLQLQHIFDTTHQRATQEQRNRAREGADLRVSNEFLSRRTSLMAESASTADKLLEVENKLKAAKLANIDLSDREIDTIRRNNMERLTGVRAAQEQTDATRVQQQQLGMGIGSATAFKIVQDKVNEAQRTGKNVAEEVTQGLKDAAAAAGVAVHEFTRLQVVFNAKYDLKLLPLSDQNIQVAKQLRQLYGDDIPRALSSPEAKLLRQLDFATRLKDDIRSLRTQIDSLHTEEATLGMSPGGAATTRLMMERRALAARQGEVLPADYLAKYDQYARLIGRATQALAEEKVQLDLLFERQTMFFTETEQKVAQVNRQLHGNAWADYANSAIANMIRVSEYLKTTRDLITNLGTELYSNFVGNMRQGMRASEAWKQGAVTAIRSVIDELAKLAIKWAVAKTAGAAAGALGIGAGEAVGAGGGAAAAAAAAAAIPAAAATAVTELAGGASLVSGAMVAGGTEASVALEAGGALAAGSITAGATTASTELIAAGTLLNGAMIAGATEAAIILSAAKIPLLGFQEGGIVPGPPGHAVPILAHAGEEVLPRGNPRHISAGSEGRGGANGAPEQSAPQLHLTFNANGRLSQTEIRQHALVIASEVARVFDRNPSMRPRNR